MGSADCIHPGPSRRERGLWGGPSPQPREEGAHHCTLYPDEETEAWRRTLLCVRSRGGARSQVPRGAPCPSIPLGVLQPGGAARTQHADREGTAGGAGPPYLDDGRAGGSGGGGVGLRLRLRAPCLPPSPGSQSRRHLPPAAWRAEPVGGAGARTSPARTPRGGHPSLLLQSTPTTLLAPGGWSLDAHTRTEQARTPVRTRRSDWGRLPSDQAEAGDSQTRLALRPGAPSLRGTGRGTRSPGASVFTLVKWKQ